MNAGLLKALVTGQKLFNDGHFFECHEFLEEAWKQSLGWEKLMLQGLIQAAAGFHKLKMGSHAGSARLLKNAAGKLVSCGVEGDFLKDFADALLDSARAIDEKRFDPAKTLKMKIVPGEGIEPTRA